MKTLLSILVIFFMCSVAKSQSSFDPVDTFGITNLKTSATQVTRALVHLPPEYNSTSKAYPVLIFLHGLGEQATNFAGLYNNLNSGGPAYFIGHGQWPDSTFNPMTNSWLKFIVVSPIHTTITPNPPNETGNTSSTDPYQLDYILQDLLARYRINKNRLYLTGLSAGGEGITAYMSNVDPATGHALNMTECCHITMGALLSGETGSAQANQVADSIQSKKIGLWGEGDPNDTHGATTRTIIQRLNVDSPGSALFAQNNFGHSHWDYYYKPHPNAGSWDTTWRGKTGVGMYEILLMDSAGPNTGGGGNPLVTPNPNKTIFINRNTSSTVGASVVGVAGATITSVAWTNTSKPSGAPTPTIVSPNSDTTNVTGLTSVGTYVFNILAIDNNGLTANANDTVFVKAGCGGVNTQYIPNVSDSGKTLVPAVSALVFPGDTLTVLSRYKWTYFSADGLHGTQACPITIINDTGQVTMYAGIAIANSTYVHVTGTGNSNYFYGFYITSYPGKPPASRGNSLQFSGRSAHGEVDHVDEYIKTYCLWLKNEADCQDSINNWRLDDFQIHDIRAKNINQDGFYLGSTGPEGGRNVTCASVQYAPVPSRSSNIRIWNITLDSVGRSGIQMSGADSGANEIYNCDVRRTGYELNPQQGSGIIIGGHSQVYVHNNKTRCTFQLGIWDLGSGLSRIENNDCDSSGHIYSPTSGADTTNPNYVPIGSDTRPTVQLWPNDSLSASGLGPLLSRRTAPTLATLIVKGNKVGVGTFLPVPGLQIDIWPNSSASLIGIPNQICSNVMEDGVTPASVRVNPGVTYSTNCTGVGNKYYFAAAGSDANACSLVSPCRSLSKFNAIVNTGDTAYFNGLDSFPGNMVIPASAIYVSSYGAGQPIFSGLISLSAWNSLGGNIYSANCSGCNANTNLLTYDGVQQTLARYPNSSTGYRSYSAFVPNTSISDATLSGTPNWTGGLLAIRNYHFVLTTNNITSHSGTTITYTPQDPSLTSSTASLGYGYFILGDSLAIDTAREYWYSVPSGKMKYYSLTSPSGHAVYTTGVDTLARLVDGISNVTLKNIKFIYSGIYGVYIGHDTNTTISNCSFQFNGEIALMNRGGVGTRILNNTITESNDAGIYIINTPDSSKNVFVSGNIIRRTGLLPGQARDQHAYMHIWSAGLNDSIFNNVLDSCGSNGIMAYNYKSVKYNSINSALMVLDDAAGIYSLGYTDTTRTQFIVKNVITNCLGNVQGTADLSNQAYGIYLDNNNFGVSVDSNSIYNITHGAFYLHNSRSCKFINNTVYQNANQTHVIYQGDDNTKPIKNNLIKKNIFGVGGVSCNIYAFINGTGVQFTGTSGTIDSNYYLYASTVNPFFIYNSGSMTMAYKRWQDSTGDAHGVLLAAPTFFQYNNTSSSVPVALTKNYYDVLYKSYYNSANIPPLGSLMLFPGSFVVYPYGLRLKAF
jgi:parallel beta-helix repeat protein